MTAAAIAAAVRAGRLRAREATERALAADETALNCFTAVTADRARREADAVDAAIAAGADPGPLAGVPFAAKNLFDIEGLTTLAGAAIERGRPPASRDAFALRRLREAGAILIGATNMDEYAYGFTTENSHFGATRNPHDRARVAGGSSGGSAAAVAARTVPIALGTDTNGSVRVPAALCGVFGLKPTYGRLSRQGAHPFVTSLDHVGLMARDAADLALAYDAAQGLDPEDPAQQPRAPEMVTPTLGGGIAGLRVALAEGHFAQGDTTAAEAVARALGATRRATLPDAARARAAAFLITMAEGGHLHLPDLRARAGEFDPLTRDRFLAGALLPAHWLLQAQRLRAAFRAEALRLFEEVDLLVTPTTPFPAPRIGQDLIEFGGAAQPCRPLLGLFTQPISCIGLPALSLPMAERVDGLPVGVQLVAAPWREELLFRAAAALERAGLATSPEPPER